MKASRSQKTASRRLFRLLLVDSDDLLRWSVTSHLQSWISVTAVRDVAEARAFLRDTVFDVVMTSSDAETESREIEAQARKVNRNLNVIRLTTKVKSNAKFAGIDLEKPFRFDNLDQILKSLLPPKNVN